MASSTYSMDLTLKDNPIKYTASGHLIAPNLEEEDMEKANTVANLGGLAEMMQQFQLNPNL